MAQKSDTPAAVAPAEAPSSGGIVRWIAGWILAPGAVVGAIFGAGVFVGAHHPEGTLTRAIVWVVRLFVA